MENNQISPVLKNQRMGVSCKREHKYYLLNLVVFNTSYFDL